jgi:hypothetical protein
MSSILPTGVGTMYNMPITGANLAQIIRINKKSGRIFAIFKKDLVILSANDRQYDRKAP